MARRGIRAAARFPGFLGSGDELMEETGVQRVSGLETWFDLPGRTAPAPPKWEMAVVTLAAGYPLALTTTSSSCPG